MVVKAENARIYGNDKDAVYLGATGATMPTALAAPGATFTDVGWLSGDGIDLEPNVSVETHRGHQGGAVVRNTVKESAVKVKFTCLETTALTMGLIHNIKSTATASGVTTMKANTSLKIVRKSAVIDVYDADDASIQLRYYIPVLEIGNRSAIKFSRGGITMYTFEADVVGDFDIITNQTAIATA